jgi:hypothetical protein
MKVTWQLKQGMLQAPPGMHLAMNQCKLGLKLLHRIDGTAAEDADYGIPQLARALGRHYGGAPSAPNLRTHVTVEYDTLEHPLHYKAAG